MIRWARGNDGGSVTAFVVIATLAVVAVTGLVLDGGLLLTARQGVADAADQAARAGAQAASIAEVRSGAQTLDPAQAVAAAHRALAATGHAGTVTITGDVITVVVTETVELQLSSLLGVTSRTVSANATARLARGVTTADP